MIEVAICDLKAACFVLINRNMSATGMFSRKNTHMAWARLRLASRFVLALARTFDCGWLGANVSGES